MPDDLAVPVSPHLAAAHSDQLAAHLPTACTARGIERCALLLDVATDLFLQHGFDQVSLDQIVEYAGGSKATIYKYFGSKEGLFLAIWQQRRDKFIQQIEHACQQTDVDLAENLCSLLFNLYLIFSDTKSMAFMRLMFQIAQRDPKLSQDLYNQGPKRAHNLLADFLEAAHQKGQIYCLQPYDSAVYFFGFFHDMVWRCMVGLPLDQSHYATKQHIAYVVQRFIAGHQSEQAQ